MEEKETTEELPNRFIYAPNSIAHGLPLYMCNEKTLMSIEIGRLEDFIEWLFDHSEHCDHITQSEAWEEFKEYEIEDNKEWRKQFGG